MSAQVVLQNYIFERFLERLSKSDYKNKFILKGGMLIAAIVGINNRSTMDMDITIKDYPLESGSLSKAINDISNVPIDDNVKFTFLKIESIREDDDYGGFRVSIQSEYDTIITPMHIDFTTGDAITPGEIFFSFKRILDNKVIGVWSYNIETVLAEKFETILRRGEFSTRPRDFYDIYTLKKTQKFNRELFILAVRETALQRETSYIFENIEKRITGIENSDNLHRQWSNYTRNYHYAELITYADIISVLKKLSSHFI